MIKDYIDRFIPSYIRDGDTLEVNGKGFLVRYLEIFGHEIDDEIYNQLDTIIDIVNPFDTQPEYLDYIATTLGNLGNITSSESDYRNLLSYIMSIYKIKGTILSYEALFYTMGLDTASITEHVNIEAFYDSPTNYDQGFLYDSFCKQCSEYTIDLTGSLPVTDTLINNILMVIKLVEPINAKLRVVNYNATPLELDLNLGKHFNEDFNVDFF